MTDDLQFHLLELPKFSPASDNLGELPPLDRWLYFLLDAEESEARDLSRMLIDDEYSEAAEVLEMISRGPEDLRFYEARMKFLHDEEARLIAVREEGREEGREKGRKEGAIAGKIQMLQQLLGEQEQSTTELGKFSGSELSTLLAELQRRLRSRLG